MPVERCVFAVLSALLVASGCGGAPGQSGTSATSASSSSSAAGGSSSASSGGAGEGGSAGEGGAEPLPPLDPAACPATADSGEDPAIAAAAETQWSTKYVFPKSASFEQDQAFFLATLLRTDTALFTDLAQDAALSALGKARDQSFRDAPGKCAEDVACYSGALVWSDSDAKSAADALHARLLQNGKLATLAKDMRSSGRFALHALKSDDELIQTAFVDLTVALDKTLASELEALGGAKVKSTVDAVSKAHPAALAFFEPLLEVDLALLTADKRDEVERYEPLEQGENAKALAAIPGIDWAKYPFTMILVPGQGPSQPDVILDPNGKARADLAAQRFAAHIAPLIALSGGHVHPDRTPYSEALEMKKYLRETYSIPEEALLVDPHARHTTTNLRNVSRLLYRYGVPTGRPVLVTSDMGQSIYIGFWHGTFGPRCLDELGYLPWRSLVPISKNDACMLPAAVSLHGDGRDPLDP